VRKPSLPAQLLSGTAFAIVCRAAKSAGLTPVRTCLIATVLPQPGMPVSCGGQAPTLLRDVYLLAQPPALPFNGRPRRDLREKAAKGLAARPARNNSPDS